MTTVKPNPFSPYADASPRWRHTFAIPNFFPALKPGGLLPTGCGRLAVVPEEPLRPVPNALPEGLCPACLAEMRGDPVTEERSAALCSECDLWTHHEGLCALCRQEKHDEWWAVRAAADTKETQ